MLLRLFRSRILATLWFIAMCVLFFLPGSTLPQTGWLASIPHVDKIFHVGLFAVLLFLMSSSYFYVYMPRWVGYLLLGALVYGLLVEFIQKYWIPNRSFDLYDVMADMGGSVAGILVWLWVYRKK